MRLILRPVNQVCDLTHRPGKAKEQGARYYAMPYVEFPYLRNIEYRPDVARIEPMSRVNLETEGFGVSRGFPDPRKLNFL